MTPRAAILGLLGAAFVSGFCYFNDCVIRQGMLIPHLMPTIVYGGAFLYLALLNPLLRLARRPRALSGTELAVVMVLVLVSCSIPSWGLIQCLPTSIMLPHHEAKLRPGWTQEKILDEAPSRLLVDVTRDEDRVLNGYAVGLGEGDRHISPAEVPWYAWMRTLGFWVPLMLATLLATLGLAVVFHRQWVHHEQLPYPISVFAHALLPAEGQTTPAVFRDRLFWIGFVIVLLIEMDNYLCRWWPQSFVPVKMYLDFSSLAPLFPNLVRGGGMLLLRPPILLTVVGLAYFIASDVAFSMAIVPFIFCTLSGLLAGYGVLMRTGDHMTVKIEAFVFTGGYLGILLILLYTGRHFYWSALRRGVGLRARETIRPYEVWGMRAFLAGTAAFVAQLVFVGLDWRIALLYTGLTLMVLIVVSRTIAETGAFHIGTEIFPGVILIGFFGAAALGLKGIIIMSLVSVVILVAPGWAPMPFIVQGLKLADLSRLRVPGAATWTGLTLLLSMAVALPLTIYWQYDRGAPGPGWPRMVATFPFENLLKLKLQLVAQGRLEESAAIAGWARFGEMIPNTPCVLAFLIALGISLAIGIGRLRFAWWPLHPVVFVFLGGYQATLMGVSFLIGWLLKVVVSRYGGARLYQRLKPLMIGVIAAEMVGALIPMIVGTVYYLIVGHQP